MHENDHRIERFVALVRARLNRHRLINSLVWTVVVGAGLVVLLGLWHTPRGYAVPGHSVVVTVIAVSLVGVLVWVIRLISVDGAAQVADRRFSLHDAITSYLHFSKRGLQSGYYALQAEQTRQQVDTLVPQEIKYEPPRRGITLAACLLAIAVPLGLRGPSDEIVRQQQLEQETAEATAAINDDLATMIDQLREEPQSDDERELLNPNQLRQWVEELRQTSDHKDALRQYAHLERKLNEARLAIRNRDDEQLLERAARELENSRQTQPLAEQLQQKNYDRASQQLEQLKPQQTQPLSQQKKELARLKTAAQHLAAAARASKSGATGAAKQGKGATATSGASASSGSQSADGASAGSEMASTMMELAQAVEELDDALDEAQRQEAQRGQCDAEQLAKCESCAQRVSDQLSELSKKLKKLGMCMRCDQRLAKLCKACSQCQGNLASLCMSPNAGGKQAGWGSNTARRDQTDELIDNGQTMRLQGSKGHGPSLSTVEAADDGSGTSTRKAASRQRTFQRQYESFVAREDVPEEVKAGVKNYFQVIHQIQPESSIEATNSK